MKRLLAVTGFIAAVALIVIGAFTLFSPEAQPGTPAMQKAATGKVSWSPDRLVVTMAPGDTKTIQVTVTASGTVPATQVSVVSALASYLTVQPSSLPSLGTSSDRSIGLVLGIPTSTPFQTIDGTVHLRAGTVTVAKPLPLILNIWPRVHNSELGVAFNAPPDWQVTQDGPNVLVITGQAPSFVPPAAPGSLEGICKVTIASVDNPTELTLSDFVSNIVDDPHGSPPISKTVVNIGALQGIQTAGSELAFQTTTWFASSHRVIAVSLICGDDFLSVGRVNYSFMLDTLRL
jgi:uncharacterized repeat protein (TIGR01451 family)